MTRIYALASVALIAAMLGVVGMLIMSARQDASADLFAQCRTSSVAGGSADIGGPFTLVSETGETVTDADVITEPSLLYFGYTFCPDVCPLDTVRNAEAVAMLEEQGMRVQPVMITVDPERDTPEVMDDFTANIHPRFLGLTGTPEQTDAAARAYRVFYRINRDGDDPYYLVDHSAFSYLVLPEHGFVEFFNRDVPPDQIAATTACFVNAAASGS